MTMTLHDFRKLPFDNFFLAIIKREMNWNDAENVFFTIPDSPSPISALDLLDMAVQEALKENNETLTQENIDRIIEEVKRCITPNLEEWYPVILVKSETGYWDLSKMERLDPVYTITCQIPMNKYYRESEISFEEDEDGPYLSIDIEPFNQFVKDYQQRTFN